MTVRNLYRGVVTGGFVASLAFVAAGTWFAASQVWARSFTQTLEVLVAAPFVAAWVLSPILWVAWPRAAPDEASQDIDPVVVTAGMLVVVASAYAYVPEFVILPWVYGVPPGMESVTTALVVPGVQWMILALGALTRTLWRKLRPKA